MDPDFVAVFLAITRCALVMASGKRPIRLHLIQKIGPCSMKSSCRYHSIPSYTLEGYSWVSAWGKGHGGDSFTAGNSIWSLYYPSLPGLQTGGITWLLNFWLLWELEQQFAACSEGGTAGHDYGLAVAGVSESSSVSRRGSISSATGEVRTIAANSICSSSGMRLPTRSR